jgi:hypothetical protein
VAGVTDPAQVTAPLGSPTTASSITPAPVAGTTSDAAGAAGANSGATPDEYYNQLNAAAGQKSMQAPSESNPPASAPAPSSYAPLPAPYTQPDTSPSPAPVGIVSAAMKGLTRQAAPTPATAAAPTPTPTPNTVTSTNQLVGPAATQPAGETNAQQNALNFAINAYNAMDGMGLMSGSTGSGTGTDIMPGPNNGPTGSNNPAYITASLEGKSTAGIPYTISASSSTATPAPVQPQVAPSPTSTISAVRKTQAAAPASTTSPATAADIAADFQANFGRQPAQAGLQFYTDALAKNPNMTEAQLNSLIISGAQGSDATAVAKTSGGAPATAADISADFAADFGRPAAATGLNFYTDYLNAHPGTTEAQLNQMIIGGAQSQDQAAYASLNGSGTVAQNWNDPLLQPANVQSSTTNPNGQDIWDAASNSWTTAPTANGILTSAQTYNPSLLGTPTQVNVGAYQTVAGQLQNLENPNSPLIQAARTQALQQANASGLLNSSMAITAGNSAAYNAALPVAQADASIYNNDAVTNAGADNQFAVDNQNAINSAAQFNAGAQNSLTGQKMTASMSAASTAQQAGTVYANWLNAIQQSTMNAGAKNEAEVQAYNTYYQQMQALAAAGIPDVSGLLSFPGQDPNTGLPDYRDPVTGLYSSTSNAPSPTPTPTPVPTPTPTPTPAAANNSNWNPGA